jgi:hypothetical protein
MRDVSVLEAHCSMHLQGGGKTSQNPGCETGKMSKTMFEMRTKTYKTENRTVNCKLERNSPI